MSTDAELLDDLSTDDPQPIPDQRILRKSRAADRLAHRIENKLTRLNDALAPDGPPIEPQLRQEIDAALVSLQAHAAAITTVAASLQSKISRGT